MADEIMVMDSEQGIAKNEEMTFSERIVQHVLICPPADRLARLAAIKESDPGAFHIVRVVVRPGEQALAA